MKIKAFRKLCLGDKFTYNGNEYEKKSSRTAILIAYNRVFYFKQGDLIRQVKGCTE